MPQRITISWLFPQLSMVPFFFCWGPPLLGTGTRWRNFTMIARILVVTVSGALAIHVPHSPHNIPLVKHHPIVELQYLKRLHAPNFFALDSKKNTRSRKVEFGQIPLHSSVVPSRKLATYFGTIGVGDNPTSNIKVLFDTGSCGQYGHLSYFSFSKQSSGCLVRNVARVHVKGSAKTFTKKAPHSTKALTTMDSPNQCLYNTSRAT
eukprot:GHVN01097427.1.p1 GENE.GHVN01097427.1~~GHVN01097427.1.p1  ORF type:complete len:206 (-),score=5.16 GHVN01097427.1:244-861(-)